MAAASCTSLFAHMCGLSPSKRKIPDSHFLSHKRRKMDDDDELPPLESLISGVRKNEVTEMDESRMKSFYDEIIDLTGENSEGEDEVGCEIRAIEGGGFEPLPAITDPTDEGYDAEDEGAHDEDKAQQQHRYDQSLTSAADLHNNTHNGNGEEDPTCMCKLSLPQRLAQYRKWFSRTALPLSHMTLPEECDIWPAFADEIHEAYLRHTTFTVKVWTNYDATAGRFYTANDQRYGDTGRLVLSPTALEKLHDFDTGSGHIRRVRFEVGTAFQTLCNVTAILRRAEDESDVFDLHAGMSQLDANYHPHLANFLESVVEDISASRLPAGASGFTIGNIINLAGWFQCLQTDEEAWDHERWPHNSRWMELGTDREANEGYVELYSVDGRLDSPTQCARGSF